MVVVVVSGLAGAVVDSSTVVLVETDGVVVGGTSVVGITVVPIVVVVLHGVVVTSTGLAMLVVS